MSKDSGEGVKPLKKRERKNERKTDRKKERSNRQASKKQEGEKERPLQNINSCRVKRKRIGRTFSGKRKSIRQAVKLGGSSKWIRLRECVR